MLGYREPFKKSTPFHETDRLKKALLIVFPEIPARETGVLDIAHANIKTACVRDGLMVAQCHARCDLGPSVHNSGLKVYQSPHPLIAMRHMALHDIHFLPDDEAWFAAYDLRFGARFREAGEAGGLRKTITQRLQASKGKADPVTPTTTPATEDSRTGRGEMPL